MKTKLSFRSILESLLPWIFLLFSIYCSVLFFVFRPYLGFAVGNATIISVLPNSQQKEESVQIGDVIHSVNGITREQTEADLTVGWFNQVKAGDTLEIVLERAGEMKTIQYIVPGFSFEYLMDRINSNWFLPYIFLLAGTSTLLFLRPKNNLRLLLALFCFFTSAWTNAGLFSNAHLFHAALALRSLVWLSMPIYLHLHWLFPSPLKPIRTRGWVILYGFAALMAVLSWFQLVPSSFYMIGFIMGVLGSVILLIVHIIQQPSERKSLLGLLIAVGLCLMPVLAIAIFELVGVQLLFTGIAVLGLAALPGFYFFTLYRHQFSGGISSRTPRLTWIYILVILAGLLVSFFIALSFNSLVITQNSTMLLFSILSVVILLVIAIVSLAPFLALPALANDRASFDYGGGRLNFSANRAASSIFFVLLEGILILVVIFILIQSAANSILGLLVVAAVATLSSLYGYPLIRRGFERLAFGMKLVPEKLMITYSERITTSLDAASLRALLVDEVMPSLLIRQFAQVKLQNGLLEPFISLRVTPELLPAPEAGSDVAAAAVRGASTSGLRGLPDWVRLVLPLRVGNETRGYWLLGQRDPDNLYPPEDIQTLKTLADQTALAVVNIEQAQSLQAFYFADIGRNEAERAALAAELHDDVLNQLAVLNTHLPDGDAPTQHAYDKATTRIRDIINGLRPTMLNYGLRAAFETLTDDLNDRLPEGPEILLNILASEVRFERDIELSLFRIVQQACNNAIRHASCQRIEISGSLAENEIHLSVQDDGKGFEMEGQVTLAKLLAGRHFGLAGMYERAALIGADLQVISAPGQGSRIQVTWIKK